MKRCVWLLAGVAVAQAAVIPMDSERGDRLFVSQGCVQCHRLKGAGGSVAPDLGRVLDRGYTPADLVSAMWNHAPAMWSAIREKGVKTGDIDEQGAADLFASFLSARFFELPGDAGRGKRLFESKTCAGCHGIMKSPNAQARPVAEWQTLSDPAGLVGAMWNHAPEMWGELSKRSQKWPALTPQELSDLLVYLRNSVTTARGEPGFRVPATANGASLFQSKGCIGCHPTGQPPNRMTLTAVAASMWNHTSLLRAAPPRIDSEEMRSLLGYYWGNAFLNIEGNAARGRHLLQVKHCASCHSGSGPGPDFSAKAGNYTAVSMLSALWRHGPDMLKGMQERRLSWPTFRSGEMEDLIAAMNESARQKH